MKIIQSISVLLVSYTFIFGSTETGPVATLESDSAYTLILEVLSAERDSDWFQELYGGWINQMELHEFIDYPYYPVFGYCIRLDGNNGYEYYLGFTLDGPQSAIFRVRSIEGSIVLTDLLIDDLFGQSLRNMDVFVNYLGTFLMLTEYISGGSNCRGRLHWTWFRFDDQAYQRISGLGLNEECYPGIFPSVITKDTITISSIDKTNSIIEYEYQKIIYSKKTLDTLLVSKRWKRNQYYPEIMGVAEFLVQAHDRFPPRGEPIFYVGDTLGIIVDGFGSWEDSVTVFHHDVKYRTTVFEWDAILLGQEYLGPIPLKQIVAE